MAAILGEEEEPDLRTDDLMFRQVRDARAGTLVDPQPKFGIPVGPVVGGADSDYLHAVPAADRYRSTFNPMRNPDLVKDDLAYRHLRKDDQLTGDPTQLGIVKDPHGVIIPHRPWRPPSSQASRSSPPPKFVSYSSPILGNGVLRAVTAVQNNKDRAVSGSLAAGLALVIRKQSAKPSAQLNDLISYRDLRDRAGYDCMRFSLDTLLLRRRSESMGQLIAAATDKRKTASNFSARGGVSKRGQHRRRPQSTPSLGRTVYEILRHGGDCDGSAEEEGDGEEDGGGESEEGMVTDAKMEEDEDSDDRREEEDSGSNVTNAGERNEWLRPQQLAKLPEVVTDSLSAAASCCQVTSVGRPTSPQCGVEEEGDEKAWRDLDNGGQLVLAAGNNSSSSQAG